MRRQGPPNLTYQLTLSRIVLVNGVGDYEECKASEKPTRREIFASRFRQVVDNDRVRIFNSIEKGATLDDSYFHDKAMAIIQSLQSSPMKGDPVSCQTMF